MSQWQQPGYQYPMQTGFPGANPQFQQNSQFQQQQPNPQFQQQNPQFLQQNPQQQLAGGLVPQRTGYVPPPSLQQPPQPGFGGGEHPKASSSHSQRVPALPAQFQGQGSTFLAPQQPNRSFLNTSPGPGLVPQQTGFPGQRPLVAQPTGFVDPRLQLMSSSLMPLNSSAPYGAGGVPQFQPQNNGMSLQQSFQQVGQKPRISWALGKAEKQSYNAIFRAWDAQNTGFISGQTALEVFAQSGVSKDDLARIWTLADIDDRGKLNLAEFHVAMGLIYRKLNGNEIPDKLPPELEPPSSKQLGESVDLVRDLLKHETRSRTPNSDPNTPLSYLPNRSFTENTNGRDSSRDATMYRHNDSSTSSYKPRSRNVDRDAVRATADIGSTDADLSDMKRALANTAAMLDRAAEADRTRTAEDEALEREMDDLKYRVKRINEDLEYASRGPRSAAKDDERRKLERELLELMHVRVPDVERKIKAREERKEREKREMVRDRDRRNERFGRFGDRDDSRERYNRDRDPRDRYDRPYSPGGYRRDDRDRDRDYDSYRPRSPARRDSERDRDRDYDRPRSTAPDRDYDRPRSTAPDRDYDRPRSAAPPDVPPLPTQMQSRPAPSPSPAPTKNMTPEERQAFARAEAKRRVEARMAALGVTPSPSATPVVDNSIEERLAQEKKEAEEKARMASAQAEEREAARREKLEREKALREGNEAPTPTSAPTPTATAPPAKAYACAQGCAPAACVEAEDCSAAAEAALVSPPAPAAPVEDPEEVALRRREEAIMKQREARAERLRQLEREEEEAERAAKAEEERRARESRAERLRQLEREEEEAARAEEERIQARIDARKKAAAVANTPTASTTSSVMSLSTRSPSPVIVAAPTPPPAPVTTPPEVKSSTNPFSRLMKEGGSATPPAATAPATNPWASATSTTSTPTAVSPPPVSAPRNNPFPAPVKTPYNVASAVADDPDDWDVIKENDDDDSSDEEPSRDLRKKLAADLFGGILPAAPSPPNCPSGTPATPMSAGGAPPPPPPPPAPGPPPPPMAPPAPFAAPAAAPSAPGDVSALMKSIQGGMKLRKAVTVDKSAAPGSGKVLGDNAPPAHINTVSVSASVPEPPAITSSTSNASNRQSVDWYNGLASDTVPSPAAVDRLPPMKEEHEYDEPYAPQPPAPVPDINVVEPEPVSDLMADIDKSTELRVRSLYTYQGEGTEDITFAENVILIANPSKTGGEWWYGKSLRDGASGMFPRTYVQEITTTHAKAVYDYTASNSDELSFSSGETLSIVDMSEEEWWKAERDGAVFIVPAGYLEVAEVDITGQVRSASPAAIEAAAPTAAEPMKPRIEEGVKIDSDSESDESESDSDSDYLSFDGSSEESEEDRAAREHERQLVLEAAGLIVKKDVQAPPRPVRRRSTRRPAPAAPDRSSVLSSSSSVSAKELPPIPELDAATTLDDAFARYEAYRGHQKNRLSVASVETNPVPASPTSPSVMSTSPSTGSVTEGRGSGFLHFLGRKTPNEAEAARSRPTISGPIAIPRPDNGGGSPSNSPAFGSSWASLVDKSALEGIPSQERRRQEAIFELIATENTYVRDLQLIVETFYSSMMPLLDRKAITVIFANIEDILLTNTTFMSSLEQRQKECRLYVDRIGDILQNQMSNMAVYMEYCVNQAEAIKVLKSLRDSNPELASHLQRLKEDPNVRNLDLSSYLLAPMQRVTRYPLLLKQILHYTEPGEEHKAIQKSVTISEKILDHINESIRDQEGRETLKRISQNLWIGQGRLDLTAPTRHMGMRRLLREGPLVKSKSGKKLHAFLCSDIMVLTDGNMKTLYRMPIPLGEAQVKDVPGGRDDTSFQISLPYPRGGEAIALRASSVRDCQRKSGFSPFFQLLLLGHAF
ncbi:Actin cytoskeleton-regulatory complex protein [Mycena sanguinolenta]|uniref:Actin cytoskeleton-regulatory complex protein PAN1 n=1 Tax=Mycena sanguinolenta TaxID=230812 RepID=A0A8H6YDH7_9AGAR|nr:Actin cytoskeleton-regulatory complex protein [Mycena sanguinolenta]